MNNPEINEYKPWEVDGITEVEYWKECYFAARKELGQIVKMIEDAVGKIK